MQIYLGPQNGQAAFLGSDHWTTLRRQRSRAWKCGNGSVKPLGIAVDSPRAVPRPTVSMELLQKSYEVGGPHRSVICDRSLTLRMRERSSLGRAPPAAARHAAQHLVRIATRIRAYRGQGREGSGHRRMSSTAAEGFACCRGGQRSHAMRFVCGTRSAFRCARANPRTAPLHARPAWTPRLRPITIPHPSVECVQRVALATYTCSEPDVLCA